MDKINIPPEAVEAAAKAMYMAEPWSTFWSIEDARSLCTAAIRAALAAWPGMLSANKHNGIFVGCSALILPLNTENPDAEA